MKKIILFSLLFLSGTHLYAAIFTSVITGDWDDGATWGNASPGSAGIDYPSATDNATIVSGTNVSLTANETIVNLVVEGGGILDALTNNKIVTINGTLDVDGTLKANNKDMIFTGGAGTSIDGTGTVFINNGGKKFKIFGNTSILASADLFVFGKIEIQNNIIVTNYGIIKADKDINGKNGNSEWVNEVSSYVKVKTIIMNNGKLTASANGNSVNFYGLNQNIKTPVGATYYNLISSGKVDKTNTQLANLIILNDFTNEGGTYKCSNFNMTIGGNWINSGGFFTEGTGTVIFNGGNQEINTFLGETFYNLQINSSGTVTVNTSDIIVSNTLTMTNGNINAESQKITLGTAPGSAGTLSHSSGTIIGYFERWLPTTTGVNYLFPLGTASNYNSANINFNTIGSGGSLIGRFVAVGPGNNGLSLVDGATTIYNTFIDGYWEFTAANSFAASDFNLQLAGNGFTGFGIDAATRVLTRADAASAWLAEGTHVAGVGSTAKRNNITTISGHYCFGDDTNCSAPTTPTITSADTDPCSSNNGAYTITNTGNTYAWSISPAGAGTFNPVPAGGDFSVNIDWGATGQVAYVICKESNGCTTSDPDTIIVNVHSIAPSSITGRENVAKATLAEPYSVTGLAGYTYTWTAIGGTVASGQGTSAITVDWDNSAGTGQVEVVAQSGSGCAAAAAFIQPVKRYEVVNSNGTGGGDWNTAASWDCNCVPLTTDNIRILTNDTITQGNYDIVINHFITEINATFERITNNKEIWIWGDFIHDGLMTLGAGNKDLNLRGINTIFDGGGTINITNGGAIEIRRGNKTVSPTAMLTIIGGNVYIFHTGVSVRNNGSVTISNDLHHKDGTNNWINQTNSTFNLGGLFDNVGNLIASGVGNTVNYNGTVNQNIVVPSGNIYYNLSSSNANTKTIQGALDINGDLLIQGTSQLDANNNNFSVAGNWTNTSVNADPFVEGTATVTLDGAMAQTITNTSGDSFNNLIVNNTSTGVTLAASSNISVTGQMTFTDGVVDSRTNSAMVIIDNGATVIGASNASHVKGFVRKIGNTAFEFPIGDNDTVFAPSSISAPTLATDAFDSEYYFSAAHDAGYDTTLKDATLDHLSSHEYWVVDRTVGVSNVAVTLSWDNPRSGGVSVLSELAVARWDGTKWVDHFNGGTTGNVNSGTITSLGAITSFSPFTLGSSTSNNPLPIELLTFEGVLNDDVVELTWTTVSEINNDFFTIERSADGKNWEEVLETDGAGTSNSIIEYFEIDYHPLQGKSYYRIKQTDFNGNSTLSNIVPINYVIQTGSEETMLLYPNPNDGQNINVKLNGFENKEVLIVVRDIRGRQLYTKAIISQKDGVIELLVMENKLSSGTYLITAASNDSLVSKKLLVK